MKLLISTLFYGYNMRSKIEYTLFYKGPVNHRRKSVQIRSFFGPYFPVFSPNAGKYGPEKSPYLDTFHVVYKQLVFKIKFVKQPLELNPFKSNVTFLYPLKTSRFSDVFRGYRNVTLD